jgi:type II secretory pathway pseudopilin PulG
MLRLSLRQHGFTLLGQVVALVILGTAVMLVANLFSSQNRFLLFLDKKSKALQVANNTVAKMNRAEFNSLLSLCVTKQVFNIAKPKSQSCVSNGILNSQPAGPLDKNINPYQLEVSRDWNGSNSVSGSVCVELARCTALADGHLLDVSLSVFFQDEKNNISQRQVNFRRAKW